MSDHPPASITDRPLRVGVAGFGYWGPNLARNLAAIPGCDLTWCCDASAPARERAAAQFPGVRTTDDLDELLSDPTLDAVALATPVPTHAQLAVRVLLAGKHCLVEKPLAQSVADAEVAVSAARDSGRLLMVGHLLEYHPGVQKLKQLADSGELGEEIYYIYGNRLNLGKLRADENALWSLGAHDVSVVLFLAGEEPWEAVAHGEAYVREGVEDVVFCFLRFPSGLSAHLHLSWLDPHKERRFTVVGSRRMATFDDMALEGKLTIYDKGFDEDARGYGEYITRSGDIFSPRIPNLEPLRIECEHFVACVRRGEQPHSDGASGLRVVRVLEQLQRSLAASTRPGRPGRPARPGEAVRSELPARTGRPAVQTGTRGA
jgi:predicted dehydrogenase